MKHFLLPVLSLALMLCACGRVPEQEQQLQAARHFEKAYEHIQRAQLGYVARGNPTSVSLTQYHLNELDKAANILRTVASSDTAHAAPAHRVLAQINTTHARVLTTSGAAAWSEQSSLISRMLSDLTAVQLRHSAATAYKQVDYQSLIQELRSKLQSEKKQAEQMRQRVNRLQQRIKKLQAKVQKIDAKRRQAASRAAKLAQKAFNAPTNKQYELYKEHTKAQQKAVRLDARVRKLQARIDLLKSKLEVANTRLKTAQRRVKEIKQSIQSLRQRLGKLQNQAREASRLGRMQIKAFKQKLKQLTAAYQKKIAQPFAEARQYLHKAVERMRQARAGSSQTLVMELAGLRAKQGQLLRTQALTLHAYLEALRNFARSMPSNVSAVHATLQQEAQKVAAQYQKLLSSARKALKKAASLLKKAVGRAAGSEQMQKTIYRQAISVNQTLAAITEEPQYQRRAAQIRAKLEKLTQPAQAQQSQQTGQPGAAGQPQQQGQAPQPAEPSQPQPGAAF